MKPCCLASMEDASCIFGCGQPVDKDTGICTTCADHSANGFICDTCGAEWQCWTGVWIQPYELVGPATNQALQPDQ